MVENIDFKEIAPSLKSDVLAAQVVIYRALQLNKDRAIASMEELARRKKNGETFDYESYIKTELAKFPNIKNTTEDILKSSRMIESSLIGLAKLGKGNVG